ncbi:hypothetical protein GGX14DRAFT_670514 [Mycena pura]|uniref:F-box domain-containing protein n=1 Tax=Mycena pura TaxID=153505 RepID=A0AAD6YI63_9AGAR|nr:hypothetical protein GGX14DRAFT_670514 [Mycena pura]
MIAGPANFDQILPPSCQKPLKNPNLGQGPQKPKFRDNPLVELPGACHRASSTSSPIVSAPVAAAVSFPLLRDSEASLLAYPSVHPDSHSSPNKSEAPLLLGRICRQWREIAVTTPALWSTFVTYRTDRSGVVLLADVWLSRAKGNPLTILVFDTVDVETSNGELFLKTICRHSSQWREVALTLPVIKLHVDGPLPLLEKLVIRSGGVAEYHPVTTFCDAPLLRDVSITVDSNFALSIGPSTIELPWAQLTTFTGRLFRTDECLFVLREASSLTECTFLSVIEVTVPTIQNILKPPPFKKLKLQGCTLLFQYMTLTGLEVLEIRNQTYIEEIESFPSFLVRSKCPLRELRLTVHMSAPQLLSCLQAVPTLEVLEVECQSISEFPSLARHLHASSGVLPRLRFLGLQRPSITVFDDLIAMLFSRSDIKTDGTVPLRRFELILPYDVAYPAPHIVDRFRALLRKGMQLHLGPPDASCI